MIKLSCKWWALLILIIAILFMLVGIILVAYQMGYDAGTMDVYAVLSTRTWWIQ